MGINQRPVRVNTPLLLQSAPKGRIAATVAVDSRPLHRLRRRPRRRAARQHGPILAIGRLTAIVTMAAPVQSIQHAGLGPIVPIVVHAHSVATLSAQRHTGSGLHRLQPP